MSQTELPQRSSHIACRVIAIFAAAFWTFAGSLDSATAFQPEPQSTSKAIRVGVLSSAKEPKANTSQGLFIKILKEAGCDAKAISADEVKHGGLKQLDLFIIGGGSGTKFNSSLGEEGGRLVEEFVSDGGGVMGSCAGGYSFVLGHNEALRYIEVANARCIDTAGGRWARGKGVVDLEPVGNDLKPIKMFYANGPLWEIANEKGFGRIEVLARFRSDIHKEGDAGGVMPGTPAIIAGTFGRGRFVLFSAHPEFQSSLGNQPMVADAAKWVTGGRSADAPPVEELKIDWSSVFPTRASK